MFGNIFDIQPLKIEYFSSLNHLQLLKMTSNTINTIGLIFDIIGVLMLFKYGLPSELSKEGTVFMAFQKNDEGEKRKWKKYHFWSKVGLLSILIGFLFQIVSNYL